MSTGHGQGRRGPDVLPLVGPGDAVGDPSDQGALYKAVLHPGKVLGAYSVPGPCQEFTLTVEKLHHGQGIIFPEGLEIILQLFSLRLSVEPLPHPLRYDTGPPGQGGVIVLGDAQRALHSLVHVEVEPVFGAVGDKSLGDKEEQYGGDEGKTDEDENETCPEVVPEDLGFALVKQLYGVSGQQKDEDREQKDVDVDEEKDEQVTTLGIELLE